MRTRLAVALVLLPWWAVLGQASAKAQDPAAAPNDSGRHDWFSLPISVSGLPDGAEFVPVTATIDLSRALEQLHVQGAVDERALRLYRISAGGQQEEEPFQFRANLQPRPPERKLLPGTGSAVSYLGEHPAGETPAGIRVAGELTWIARGDASGRGQYRLDLGVPKSGRAVQVPFPPQNLRMFDEQGRATPVPWFPEMQVRPQWPMESRLHVFAGQQLVTSYYLGTPLPPHREPSFRRPFLYPLNGPEGISLTEFGKPHDPTGTHAHHYSLWVAHASVSGKDFWSEKGGRIAHDQFELIEDGPLFCRITQKTRWMDGDTALLVDQREFKFYRAAADFRLIDVSLQFSPAHAEPVTLGKTSFGFLAVRVAQSMTVFDGSGEILNANGDRNEQGAHLKRAAWLDQAGPIAPGKWNGIAIFDHRHNVNHPTGWHCRNDGWAGAAFNMEQPYTLEPGKPLQLRYRICLHRHDAIRGHVARRYAEFAAAPSVAFGGPVAKGADR